MCKSYCADRILSSALLVFVLLLAGCRRSEVVPYSHFLGNLTNVNAIVELDLMGTSLVSSSDITGANEDYNHFQGETRDGELILADLNGPGVVSRFWFTGVPADAKIRFYFDGEPSPRLEFTWDQLRQGLSPFDTPPLSIDEQICWYTYLPITFQRRLLITTENRGYTYGGSPKFYYQINWQRMPRGKTVESLPVPMPDKYRDLMLNVAHVWETMNFGDIPQLGDISISIPPGQEMELWKGDGPATLQNFALSVDLSTIESAWQRDQMLRHVLLQIHWDDQQEPSVNVPLGDFFGSVWQAWRSESMYFGLHGSNFFSRFPMPFMHSARVSLQNRSPHSIEARFSKSLGSMQTGGYFHAGWRNSPASAVGTPHTVLKTNGKGRFVGCMLAVVSADRSFWVLESDERMFVDGKWVWDGTGLEDYFNSGWYYENVFARPLHGLPIKAPFRTVQYRLHTSDPVVFSQEFEIQFERGPKDDSRATYESVAYYYMDRPYPADSTLSQLAAPVDEVQPYTIMTDLWNFERFGDFRGQIDYIDRYKEQFNPPFKEMLALRRLACQFEKRSISKEFFLDQLQTFLESGDETVVQQSQALEALYDSGKYLLQFYANMQSELYLNGERVLTAGDPQQPMSLLINLKPGRHVLAAASAWQSYPSWTQVAIRNAEGFVIGTDGSWRQALNPSGDWMELDYDDTEWDHFSGFSARVKGPPEEPYIWVHPEPFLHTLSVARGLRASLDWPHRRGRIVFRKVFDIE